MQLILLVTPEMVPVPDDVKIVQEYGYESIVINQDIRRRVSGTSMFLEAEPEAFRKWLMPFDGIWKSNNPMMGKWEQFHIKESSDV